MNPPTIPETKNINKYHNFPKCASILSPKTHRKIIFDPIWSKPACKNIEVIKGRNDSGFVRETEEGINAYVLINVSILGDNNIKKNT